MSSRVIIETKGLVVAPGELSRAPGALSVADNVNVEAPGVIRSRTGCARQTNTVGAGINKLLSTKELGATNLLANFGLSGISTGLRYGDGSAAWSAAIASPTGVAANYTNQPATRMQCAVGRNNHYLTTDEGVRRLEGVTSPWMAGLPKALGMDLTGPASIFARTVVYSSQTGVFAVGQTLTGGATTGTIWAANPNSGSGGGRVILTNAGNIPAGAITDPVTGAATGAAISAGFLAQDASAAYRHTWCKKDAEGVVMEGAPSGRVVVYNNGRSNGYQASVAQNVICRLLLPTQPGTTGVSGYGALTTAYFYRLYRTEAQASGTDAGDNCRLVAEAYLTAGNISAGYVDVYDDTPEAFRQSSPGLYTNEDPAEGGEPGLPTADGLSLYGVQNANDPPPRARCVAQFAGCMFYGNLLYPWSCEFTVMSTDAGVGITAGDVFLVSGVNYTAIAPGVPSADQFCVYNSLTLGAGVVEGIERTVMSLCDAINRSTTNTAATTPVWAYYVQGASGMPGSIRLEARSLGAVVFGATPPTGRLPAVRPNTGGAILATQPPYPNAYTFSKKNQADAVPAVNMTKEVGRGGSNILAIRPLADCIYIFTDAGLYRLNGRSYGNFAVNEFDLTFRLLGRELVCEDGNYLYAWGHEGIARISSAGVEYISNAIEPLLQSAVLTVGNAWLASYAFSVAWTLRHKVAFFIPISGSLGNCDTALVFDTRMESWSRWKFTPAGTGARAIGYGCGVARVFDDVLFTGQWNTSGDGVIFKERRAFTAADYTDDTTDTTGEAISKAVRWSAAVGSPDVLTHWDELHLLYDLAPLTTGTTATPLFSAWTTPTAASVAFLADRDSNSGNISIAPTVTSRMSRCLVPTGQRRSSRLTVTVLHSVAGEYFGLEGIALVYRKGNGTATVRT